LIFCKDGTTVRDFDLTTELAGRYFVLLFFPMDFTTDAEELRGFASQLKEFQFNETTLVAISADSAYTTL
jgi:peroxiredoxin